MQGCSCCPWLWAASRGSTTAWGETKRLRVRRLFASVADARRGGAEIAQALNRELLPLVAFRSRTDLVRRWRTHRGLGGAVAGAREPRGFEEGRPREEHSQSNTRNRT